MLVNMVYFALGIFILLGSVGSLDYATEIGSQPPSMLTTLLYCLCGVSLMGIGVRKINKEYQDDDVL